ncbi:ATP-binding cassette domain-containing protein [Mesorhizobium sp. M1163]|uniref:ATP-binding cassette domain-containing protein n=1 Tax=Mesorhizobium sp. M1163 TaxID=2957065 RepID=UPI0033397C18
MNQTPILQLESVSKHFGGISALTNVSLAINAGEVTCLLGDNGAGKSTLIKIMSGVHQASSGTICVDGKQVLFSSPRDAQDAGIATVYQDIGTFPLMSVARNFFVGREIKTGWGLFRRLDSGRASAVAVEQLAAMGITRVGSGDQPVGTLSGGERQALAISRALYFGARLLILDEPTSALGVKEAGIVLRLVQQAKARGVAVVFITHNAHHALTIGDRFTVLIQGAVAAQFRRGERSKEELLNLMAGGEELETLQIEMEGLHQAGALPS